MLNRLYRDFDAFYSDIRDVDCRMTLVNPSEHKWSIDAVLLPGVSVQLGKLGSGNIVEGQARTDGWMLYLPITNGLEYRVNGTAFGRDSFMVLPPGSEFTLSTKTEHDWCAISISSNELVSRGHGWENAFDPEAKACRVVRPDRRLAALFEHSVGTLANIAADMPTFESSSAASNAALELTGLAAEVLRECAGPVPEKPHKKGRPKLPRDEIVRRCKGLLENKPGARILARDLAAASSVSNRTLENAFLEYYGFAPKRFLHLRLLNDVHRELRGASVEEESVTDVLVRNGVWEFGRFASRYRRLFGELPSETLRNSGRRWVPKVRIDSL